MKLTTPMPSPFEFFSWIMELDGTTINASGTMAGDAALSLNNDSSGDLWLALGGGDVGIGVTDPAARLDVQQSGDDGGITLRDDNGEERIVMDAYQATWGGGYINLKHSNGNTTASLGAKGFPFG